MMTETERMEAVKQDLLRSIRYQREQLQRQLEGVKKDAQEALDQIEKGNVVFGMHSFGPIGHQAPFDIAKTSSLLRSALDMAIKLGVSEEDIHKAYEVEK